MRTILLDIDEKLSNEERKKLCFLIGHGDVPRRTLESVTSNRSNSMVEIWENLFDRGKISISDVSYITERLHRLGRSDLVRLLDQYQSIHFSITTQPTDPSPYWRRSRINPNDLFHRIDPYFICVIR